MTIKGISRETKIVSIFFLTSFTLFIYLNYGSIDDFAFRNCSMMKVYGLMCRILERDPLENYYITGNPGFFSFGIILSKVTNISYDVLYFLPIQLLPSLFLLYSIFHLLNKDVLLCSLLILIKSTFSWNSGLTFWSHGLGSIIFYLVIFLVILQSVKKELKANVSVLLVICIISVNYISYKATLWVVSFLLVISLLDYIRDYLYNRKGKFVIHMNMTLISAVITLSFNKFFYSDFLPSWRIAQENTSGVLGIEKIIRLFNTKIDDPLSNYGLYFAPPKVYTLIVMSRQLIFLILICACIVCIVKKVYREKRFDFHTQLFVSILIVTSISVMVYNLLGAFDAGLIIFVGYFALLMLSSQTNTENTKKHFYVLIIFILILNFGYCMEVDRYNLATKDDNYFKYIDPSVNWYSSHGSSKLVKTDVLTKGYYIKQLSIKKTTVYPTHFSIDNILFLINKNNNYKVNRNDLFVINKKMERISITNWNIIYSLKYYEEDLNRNNNIIKIYDSKSFNMYEPLGSPCC